jgi:hypothetical protein
MIQKYLNKINKIIEYVNFKNIQNHSEFMNGPDIRAISQAILAHPLWQPWPMLAKIGCNEWTRPEVAHWPASPEGVRKDPTNGQPWPNAIGNANAGEFDEGFGWPNGPNPNSPGDIRPNTRPKGRPTNGSIGKY